LSRNSWYISTTASDANAVAREHSLGIEIAQYCTAWNMDERFTETDRRVRNALQSVDRCTLHAPFSELFPCAIDPKARELANLRYKQAIKLAGNYGASKVIVHGGYTPKIYYPIWYIRRSIDFWKSFMEQVGENYNVVLENVFEETPDMLLDIVARVNDPRFRICLDVGHINVYSRVPVLDWLEQCAEYVSHFHIHNNDGSLDSHNPPREGSIPIKELLQRAYTLCPHATYTLELTQAQSAVVWLEDNGLL